MRCSKNAGKLAGDKPTHCRQSGLHGCLRVCHACPHHTYTHTRTNTYISSKTHTLARPCSAGVYIQRLLSVAWIVNQRFRRTCSDWGKFFNHFFVLRRPSRHLTFLASLQLRLLQLAMPCKKLEKTNYNCIYLDKLARKIYLWNIFIYMHQINHLLRTSNIYSYFTTSLF